MDEQAPGTEILHLAPEFPPVPTADWEAAIARDLKGADYEKKLVWRTDEGIAVRPYYRREHLEAVGDIGPLRVDAHAWEEAQSWTPPAAAVRADYLHEAGATAVQELGFALAESVEKNTAEPVLVFAVGSNYFFEIAKLRAIRQLWAAAAGALGLESPKLFLHVRTARANKSVYDAYTNLLRVTTESLSAVIGGCDSLDVESFGFDKHLALNVQRILREEAHISKVSDPAAGSYYIEVLTDSLAREAWKLFQTVEGEGGWSKAVESGAIEKALTASREAKAKAIASRRRTLVGVNNYPNVKDKQGAATMPAALPDDPFPQIRAAEPFEAIRERTNLHAEQTGGYPLVLLLKRGDIKMKGARANFCMNFFGCAGFDVEEGEEYSGAKADLIVLCSSDAEYVPFAREVCSAVNVPVLVAGNPKEQIAELQAAGVQGFVHVLSNAVETLTEWQNKLGMPAAPAKEQRR